MMNQVILVGRIAKDLKKEVRGDRTHCVITLAVPRSFKNTEGIYETDFIDVTLWDGIARNVEEYCHKGDMIAVKGRLDAITNEEAKKTIIIAEKVTFLASTHRNEESTERRVENGVDTTDEI